MKGLALLKKHGVEFNIMGVVNDYNVNMKNELDNQRSPIDVMDAVKNGYFI